MRDGEKVLSIIPGAVVTVITSLGEHRAKSLVVTAGAWTGPLLASLGLHLPLQVRGKQGGTGARKTGSGGGMLIVRR